MILRLILANLGGRRGETAALALLTMLTIATGTAAPLLLDRADRAAFSAEIAAADAEQRSITISVNTGRRPGEVLGELAAKLSGAPGLETFTGAAVVSISNLDSELVAREGFCAHLKLSGPCPQRAGEIAASSASGVKPGEVIEFSPPGAPERLRLTVVSLYEPEAGITDPFWAGRASLAPGPLREANPLFTPFETIDGAKSTSVTVMLDLVAVSLEPDQIDEVDRYVNTFSLPTIEVSLGVGLRELSGRLAATRGDLAAAVIVGALQLMVLCWLVLLLAVSHLALRRRPEIALGQLRGIPGMAKFLMTQGPTVLTLLVSAPLGAVLGWTAVSLLAGGPVVLTSRALLFAAAVLLIAVVSAIVVEHRAHAVSLLDALREVPARGGSRGALVAEAAVVVLAVLAIVQSRTGNDGLATLAPLGIAALFALLLARLLPALAALTGPALIKRNRLGPGLALLYLARRPGAGQLAALILVAVAMLTHAAIVWDTAREHATARAEAELGAHRVLTVQAASRPALLAAVRKADPQGDWGMAVARLGQRVLAVDSPRLAKVAQWPDAPAGFLRPEAMPPITVTGRQLVVEFEVLKPLARALPVTAALVGPDGRRVGGFLPVGVEPGTWTTRLDIPECATAPGCRLAWLSFPWAADDVHLARVAQAQPDQTLVADVAQAARWRRAFGKDDEVSLLAVDGRLQIRYNAPRPPPPLADARIQAADAPVPLPVVAKGSTDVALFGGVRPIEVVREVPSLAGFTGDGMLADLEYADRISDSFDNSARLEVWLHPDAPADAERRLRDQGLVILASDTVERRGDRYRGSGAALGEAMRLGGSAAGVVLAALALLVVAATDRRRRVAELESLRHQGFNAVTAARAFGGYGIVVACALPLGVLAGVLAAGPGDTRWIVTGAATLFAALSLFAAARWARRPGRGTAPTLFTAARWVRPARRKP